MEDSRRRIVTGPAVSVRGHSIDTDRIIPARFLKCVVFDGLGEHAFADDRTQQAERGETHPLDDPRFARARLLFVNQNFGCGSSREHAPQALARWQQGITAIVGESFAEIFYGNCLALGIPCVTATPDDVAAVMALNEREPAREFRLDLEKLVLTSQGHSIPVQCPDGPRNQLLEGRWDSTGDLLAARDQVLQTAKRLPYFASWA
jgi:3-isopropylmalate/(R)-2-methylmalate dehydratase small subunit